MRKLTYLVMLFVGSTIQVQLLIVIWCVILSYFLFWQVLILGMVHVWVGQNIMPLT
jgi:hypothetical protein